MNKFSKLLVLTAFALFGQAAFAQSAPIILGQGYQGGSPFWGGVPQQRHVWYPQGYQGNMQVVPTNIAISNGFNRCEVVGAVVGGTIGSFAKNHRWQAVVLGGILGGLAGDQICYNGQGQQVLVRDQPQGQQPQEVRRPASCIVGGEDFGDIPESSCLKIREKLTVLTQSETRREVTTDARCRLTRNKDGVSEEKWVVNPSRSQQFCDNLPNQLRAGTKRWEDL